MDKELYVSDEINKKADETPDDVPVGEGKTLIIEEIVNGISYNMDGKAHEEVIDEIPEDVVEAISDMPIVIPSDLEVPIEVIAKSRQRADIERLYNQKPPKKKKINLFGVLLLIIFSIVVYFITGNIFMSKSVDTYISIDINPSMEIKINNQNKVLSITALNADAKKIIESSHYKGKKIDEVLSEIFLLLSERIYINEENDIMLLSVGSKTNRRAEKIKTLAFNTIIEVFSNKSIKPRVIRQSFVINENVKREAEQYGVSTGRVQFLNMMIKQSPYAISYLSKLPIEELFDIMEEDKIQFTKDFERSLYADQVNKVEDNSIVEIPDDMVILDEQDKEETVPEKKVVKKEVKKEIPKEEVKEIPKEEVKEIPKEEVKEIPKEEVKDTKPNVEIEPKPEEITLADEIINT